MRLKSVCLLRLQDLVFKSWFSQRTCTSAEKLCLRRNDFQENTLSSYKELSTEKEFTDVTLACGDGQQVMVHRVVLIISSPLFQNLLTNRNPHPMIIMRGVNMDDLVAMMDFLCCGEANVLQENLDTFLALANELQLKGLTGDYNTNYNRSQSPEKMPQKEDEAKVKPMLQKERRSGVERDAPLSRNFESTVSLWRQRTLAS